MLLNLIAVMYTVSECFEEHVNVSVEDCRTFFPWTFFNELALSACL